jgi:hypothetical protein
MATDNFCFYLQNRVIQLVKQEVNGTVIVFPACILKTALLKVICFLICFLICFWQKINFFNFAEMT